MKTDFLKSKFERLDKGNGVSVEEYRFLVKLLLNHIDFSTAEVVEGFKGTFDENKNSCSSYSVLRVTLNGNVFIFSFSSEQEKMKAPFRTFFFESLNGKPVKYELENGILFHKLSIKAKLDLEDVKPVISFDDVDKVGVLKTLHEIAQAFPSKTEEDGSLEERVVELLFNLDPDNAEVEFTHEGAENEFFAKDSAEVENLESAVNEMDPVCITMKVKGATLKFKLISNKGANDEIDSTFYLVAVNDKECFIGVDLHFYYELAKRAAGDDTHKKRNEEAVAVLQSII